MRKYERTRWFVAVPLAIVSTLGLAAASKPVPTSAGCNAVGQWVVDHERELPTTYAEIIRYPTKYRKAIQARLPWAVRRDMWLTQLRLYAESDVLSPRQKAFIVAAEVPFAEMLRDGTTQARRREIGDSLNTLAAKILSRDLHHAIFFVLGPDEPDATPRSAAIQQPKFLLAALSHPVDVPAVVDVNCDCHERVNGPECSSGGCKSSSCTTSEGCGDGGAFSCNGRCDDATQ